jgi:hypothetical protein
MTLATAGVRQLAALGHARDLEVRELRLAFERCTTSPVAVRDRDLADAIAADVDDARIDPLRRRARHVGIAIDEISFAPRRRVARSGTWSLRCCRG